MARISVAHLIDDLVGLHEEVDVRPRVDIIEEVPVNGHEQLFISVMLSTIADAYQLALDVGQVTLGLEEPSDDEVGEALLANLGVKRKHMFLNLKLKLV